MTPPAAWFDLVCRLAQVGAVADCILSSLPAQQDSQADLNRVGHLAGAVRDLLMLAERDMDALERQLQQAG